MALVMQRTENSAGYMQRHQGKQTKFMKNIQKYTKYKAGDFEVRMEGLRICLQQPTEREPLICSLRFSLLRRRYARQGITSTSSVLSC
jgi:hypothetical protein